MAFGTMPLKDDLLCHLHAMFVLLLLVLVSTKLRKKESSWAITAERKKPLQCKQPLTAEGQPSEFGCPMIPRTFHLWMGIPGGNSPCYTAPSTGTSSSSRWKTNLLMSYGQSTSLLKPFEYMHACMTLQPTACPVLRGKGIRIVPELIIFQSRTINLLFTAAKILASSG